MRKRLQPPSGNGPVDRFGRLRIRRGVPLLSWIGACIRNMSVDIYLLTIQKRLMYGNLIQVASAACEGAERFRPASVGGVMKRARFRNISILGVSALTIAAMLSTLGGGAGATGARAIKAHATSSTACTTTSPCTAYISVNFTGNAIREQFLQEINLTQTVGALAGKVKVIVSSAGSTVQDQAQNIENIATKKPQILVILPSSETGLDAAIQVACSAGVTVVSFDSPVDAPCAHSEGINFLYEGTALGAWLGEEAHGKTGVILEDTGIPGIPFETPADQGFTKGIKMTDPNATVVTFQGGLAAGPEKAAIASVAASYKSDLLGIAGITAGAAMAAGIKEAGLSPVPMTDMTAVNTDMAACLKPGQKCFYGATPGYEGAYGLREAVEIRAGSKFPSWVAIPPGWFSNAGQIKAFPSIKPQSITVGKTVFPSLSPSFSLPYTTSWLPVTAKQVVDAKV